MYLFEWQDLFHTRDQQEGFDLLPTYPPITFTLSMASKKFSGRRKASLHCTDFPIMRPWILDLVRIAKHSLDDALKGLGSKADPLGAYTSQDVPGLGLCVVLGKDILKGQKAYSAMLQKYGLHVRLITIGYIDLHAFLPVSRFSLLTHI